jgi:hypothetical protein
MLKWISRSKVDHPLADLKEARAVIDDIASYDCVRGLDEIARWLDSLSDAEGFKLERLFEVIDLFDCAARNHHRKLVHDYLAMPRQQKLQENRLWTCGFRYAKTLGDLYLDWVRRYAAGSNPSGAKKVIPLVVARGMRTLALQIKWVMLRYGPFEPRLWASIGELYRHAEAGGFTTTALTIYPGARGSGTVQQEFLRIMMLWASSADVLSPIRQDIAERAVAYVARAFRLERSPFAGATYAFDPASDARPVRLFGETGARADLYYFGPGDAAATLGAIVPALEKTGALPADVHLGADYPGDLVLSVLKQLCQYWSDKPPARGSERRATTARITVVPGYAQIVDTLEHDDSDALNFSVTKAESWVVQNVSETGYGALVPGSTTDWIRVGELIGVQVEGSAAWGVALVRRVLRDEQRQYHVGIEVISRDVHVVRVAHAAGREPESALLLARAPDRNGEVGLLLRAGRFVPGTTGDLFIKAAKYTITPIRMVDAGDDFDWAMYRVTRPA